jgi:hypothetical protein
MSKTIPIIAAESLIPSGSYCYKFNGKNTVGEDGLPQFGVDRCPFWDMKPEQPEQMNGYCHYMKQGDFEAEHLSLLWDGVKECGINDEEIFLSDE